MGFQQPPVTCSECGKVVSDFGFANQTVVVGGDSENPVFGVQPVCFECLGWDKEPDQVVCARCGKIVTDKSYRVLTAFEGGMSEGESAKPVHEIVCFDCAPPEQELPIPDAPEFTGGGN